MESESEAREDHHVAIARIQKDVEYLREHVDRISKDLKGHTDQITTKLDMFTASFITRQTFDDKEKSHLERAELEHEGIRSRIRIIEKIVYGIGAWVLYQIGELIVRQLT